MKGRLSIITVVYNGKDSIEQTILSVLDLQRPDVEYIIIDGGSGDGTADIIRRYEDRITYWVSEPDKGIYDAMNKGWERAKEDSFVLFLGSGDKILQLPAMDDFKGRDVIYGPVYLGDTRKFNATADVRLKLGNTLHHQALLVKKSIHPQPPFNLLYRTYADFDFNQRLYKAKHTFLFCEDLVGYAMPGGVSSKFNYRESLEIVYKNFGIFWCLAAMIYYAGQNIKNGGKRS